MGWNPFKGIEHAVSTVWHGLEQIPGSPEAVLGGLAGGLSGKLSWNPYSSGNSVWDFGAGGSKLSQNPNDRRAGRTIGTALAAYFGLGALSSAGSTGTEGPGISATQRAVSTDAATKTVGSGISTSDLGALGSSFADTSGLAGGSGITTADGSFGAIGASGGGSFYDQLLTYYQGLSTMQKAQKIAGTYGLLQSLQNRRNFSMPSAAGMQGSPGYKAGLDAIQATMAQQGYTGGSNAAAAIGKYGSDFYNNYYNQKMGAAQMQSANGVNTIGSLALLFGG